MLFTLLCLLAFSFEPERHFCPNLAAEPIPGSHQRLNMFEICLVKHGLRLFFFIKVAY